MLNDDQRVIFSKMLDVNWNATQERDFSKKFKLYEEYAELENQLKKSMGDAAFNNFMSMGKRMFS